METPEAEPDFRPRRRSRVWLAAIPFFLFTMASMGWSVLRYAGMLPTLDDLSFFHSKAQGCASVYGVGLYSSESYVSAEAPKPGPGEVQQRELATVVSGMVENKCDEPLAEVRILLHVRDAEGRLHQAWTGVSNLGAREAKPFERAMMGEFTGPEVVKIR